jgi:hypothetical protein
MMHSESRPSVDIPPLPPARDKMPTLPFDLSGYAQWSSLPDEEDDLEFIAGPPLEEIQHCVPRLAVEPSLLVGYALQPREACLLSLLDGLSPVSMLVELTGKCAEESLVVLCDLHARGLIAFE